MKQDIEGRLKKCQKCIVKLLDKIDLITTIMDSERPQSKPKNQQEQKPEIIISDEASVEVVLSSNERDIEKATNLKPTAIRLISRFYHRIKEKMTDASTNQIEALKMINNNNLKEDPYSKLYFGFFKIYFDNRKKCKECHQTFTSTQLSINHILTEHLKDVEVLICIKCKMTFQKRDILEKHILLEHTQQVQKQIIQKQPIQIQEQPKKKAAKSVNFINHSFNQKIDLSKIIQNTPPQPVLKKVFVPVSNNESIQETSNDEKTALPLFNQIYTAVDDLEINNDEKNIQNVQEIKSLEIPRRQIKLKIRVIKPEID